MTPQIIFQDNEMLVINKPSGMIVNKADTTLHEITVQDWVEKQFSIFNFQFPTENNFTENIYNGEYEDPRVTFKNRAGIVHRLDKETSGILLIAKNPESFVNLQLQFKERTIKKTYQALVHGELPEGGEIRVPVGRLPWNRKRFGVIAGGRESVTKYKLISYFKYSFQKVQGKQISNVKNSEILSLLELYPETGRTHQIRVHLQHLRHPIFSDELYAGRKTAREDRKYLHRLFLHASGITFIHPTTKEKMSLIAPLPEDLQQFLDTYCVKI